MSDFKYEVKYLKKKTVEVIAGFNNTYIALKFYENFVERALGENWDASWKMQLVDTETDKVLSEHDNL